MIEAKLIPIDIGKIKNIVIVKVSGDWNDGDWITETYEFTLEDFERNGYKRVDAINEYGNGLRDAPEEIREMLYDLEPSGQPDGADMHTLVIEEIYAYDVNGHKCAISW